jgi:autotransporter translocation and assembly factor TamB
MPDDKRDEGAAGGSAPRRSLAGRLARDLAKVLAGLLLLVAVVALAATVLLRMDWVHEKVRAFALDRLRSAVHGQVEVERLEGDLLRGVTLRGVRISDVRGEPFVAVREIDVNYEAGGFLSRKILLGRVRLVEPRITLVQDSTGNWNYLDVLPFLRGGGEGARPGWGSVVRVRELRIVNGALTVASRREPSPFGPLGTGPRIVNLNGRLALDVVSDDGGHKRVSAEDLSFAVERPGLEVRELDARATFTSAGLEVSRFLLRTAASELSGSGTVRDLAHPVFELEFKADPMALAELRRFAPKVPFEGTVQGTVGISGPSDNLQLTLRDFELRTPRSLVSGRGTLTTQQEPLVAVDLSLAPLDPADARLLWKPYPLDQPLSGKLRLEGRRADLAIEGDLAYGSTSGHVSGTLGLEKREPTYDLRLDVRALDLQDVFHDPAWASRISGEFRLTGSGMGPAARAGFGGRLRDTRLLSYELREASFEGRFRPGAYEVQGFRIHLPNSVVEGSGVLPYDRTIDLQVRGASRDLQDFYPAIGPTPARRFEASGQLAGPYTGLDLQLTATADSLAWNGLVADSLEGTAEFIDIGQPSFRLALDGTGHDVSYLRLLSFEEAGFRAGFEGDTMGVALAMRMDSTRTAEGHLGVEFSGRAPRVVLDRGRMTVGEEQYTIEEPSGFAYQDGVFTFRDFALSHGDERVAIDGTLRLEGEQDFRFHLKNVSLDDFQTLAGVEAIATGVFTGAGTVTGTDRAPVIEGEFQLDEGRVERIKVHRLEGRVAYADRRLGLDVDLAPETSTADSSDPGSVHLSGSLPLDLAFGQVPNRFPDEALDLTIKSQGLSLALVQALSSRPIEASGPLELDLRLQGRASSPRLDGRIGLSQGRLGTFAIHRFEGRLDYAERQLQLDVRLEPETPRADTQSPGVVVAKGTFPVDLAFGQVERRIPDLPMDLRVQSEGVDLGLLRSLTPKVAEAAGPVEIDLHLSGTPSTPHHEGSIMLRDGSLRLRDSGTRYTGIGGALRFDDDQILLQDLRVASGSGDARFDGRVSLRQPNQGAIEAALQAHRFTLIDEDDKLLIVDADLALGGTIPEPAITGKVNIDQLSWPLPERTDRDVIDLNKAILYVRAEGDSLAPIPPPPFWSRTLLGVDVTLEDDAVLKSDQALIVLQGDLTIQKARGRDLPSLAGTLDVVRGFYSEFGTQFEVEEGELFFYGTPDLNPGLHIVATTTIRNGSETGQDVEVTLTLGGTVERPTLELTSTPTYEKSEIFSLLLFGTPTPDLTQEKQFQSTISRVATSQAALPLQRALASELGLDLLEIQPAMGAMGAGFRAGKYIASDVFVSYSQITGAQDESRFGIQYRLSRRWTIETEAGARNGREQVGADIFYEFQY